ncbi:MAG: phosphatidylglycerophosphatase A [Candidatus Cloacimonetes bacterium]|nr:phosphatidylglycerophosphatase A [Candidatus Cloacimonadota bacterium]
MKNTDKIDLYSFLASFFGIGFLPRMPGTWGSLVAFGIYFLLPVGLFTGTALYFSLPLLLLFSLLAVYLSAKAELSLGHDSGHIVIDEVCGYYTAVMFLPQSWLIGLYAFALFRVFDIAKPWPVSISQKLPRGWGIVADDLLAGIYANILIQILIRIFPGFFGS